MPRKKKMDDDIVEPNKVVLPVLLDINLLDYDEKNTNKQDRETFAALVENIKVHGLDEFPIVIPNPNSRGRYIVTSGNHRVKACRKLNYTEVPCVVRDTWDEAEAYLQGVRRNLSRGKLDKAAFSRLVDDMQSTNGMSLSDIQEGMGITDMDTFADIYQADQAVLAEASVQEERVTNTNKDKVKIIPNLELMISHILEEYGDTVPHSFIVVPVGDKKHMFIQTNNALKNVLSKVAARTVEKGMDLATVLSGLLTIGLYNTDFMAETAKVETAAQENTTDPDDTDFERIV